jgi:magnesium-transporting ATPase (P-type)
MFDSCTLLQTPSLTDQFSQVCGLNFVAERLIFVGEAFPVRGTVDSTEENFLETSCIGMAGTHCVMGSAQGIVVFTGDRSVFGQV